MLSRGIIFIVFGDVFNELGALCCLHSRKYTNLPFQILTNISKNKLHPIWNKVSDTFFDFLDASTEENRVVKCQLHEYSRFDIGMLLDADSTIQLQGIDSYLNKFKGDLAFNLFDIYTKDRILGIYKRACKQFDCTPPIEIYNGAIFAFRKSTTKKFFDTWLEYWTAFGRRRDMPPLACLIKKMKQKYRFNVLPENMFAADGLNAEKIVQHCYSRGFYNIIGLDKRLHRVSNEYPGMPLDWQMVNWSD
jgi:hypothetical protein